MNQKLNVLLFLCVILASPANAAGAGSRESDDIRRIGDANQIVRVILDYKKKTRNLPLQDGVIEEDMPFVVFIGRNAEVEDWASNLSVLKRGAGYVDSREFDEILTEGIGHKIVLPRDPQQEATFAPNVYVYFVTEDQFCVAVHLEEPTEKSVEYSWENGVFHSHTLCFIENDET